MADREKETPVERVIILDQNEAARRAAAERFAAEQAGESPFKKVPPGGVYRWPDGRFHDAHGREVSEDGKLASETNWELPPAATAQLGGPDVTDAAAEGPDAEDGEWREDMKAQRRESIANPVEGAPMFGDPILPPLEDDEEEEEDPETGTKRRVKKSAKKRGR